jgi:hypothetical protein
MQTQVQPVTLEPEEWEIITDLLKREVRNLPIEVRHTDIRAAREALHRQLERTETLLNKLTAVLEA